MIWLEFFVWAALVILAGMRVGPLVVAIGERLRLGQAWAGTVMLSFATTLPEMVTTVSVASRGAIGIALGGVLGSCIFNLFIVVFVDLLSPRAVFDRLSASHIASGLLGCALLALAIIGIGLGHVELFGPAGPRIGPVGLTAISILLLWGAGQVVQYRISKQDYADAEPTEPSAWSDKSLTVLVLWFAGLAAVIVVAAYRLGLTVEAIADEYALGATFAGATLLGIVTSLPEITNAMTSTRRGQLDLVIGNIVGANAFLLVVLAVADIFFLGGALFYKVGRTEAMSAIIMAATAIVMQAIMLGAIAIRSAHRIWRLGIVSVLLLALYGFSLAVAYEFSGS